VATLYGIKNCDTVKKAKKWLDDHHISYQFHDFRADGLTKKQVTQWIKSLGWEVVVNKRSTTWKQLDPATRDTMDDSVAIDTIIEHPTLIKRPLLDLGNSVHVGFKADDYQQIFN